MSLPFYGGMRHINIVPGAVDQVCGQIRELREADLNKVAEFVGQLKDQPTDNNGRRGSAKALLEHAGKFSFNEGEREILLSMVLDARKAGVQ